MTDNNQSEINEPLEDDPEWTAILNRIETLEQQNQQLADQLKNLTTSAPVPEPPPPEHSEPEPEPQNPEPPKQLSHRERRLAWRKIHH